MSSETSAALVITGTDLEPDQVTTILGVQPTKTWKIGDIITDPAIIRYKHSGWRLQSNLPGSSTLNEHIVAIMNVLQPQWDHLAELSSKYEVELACVTYIRDAQGPEMNIDSIILRRIAELGASLDIDIYCLSRHAIS